MNNRLAALAVVLVIGIYVFLSSIFVLNERQQAIVLRFGEITRVVQGAWVVFQNPNRFH